MEIWESKPPGTLWATSDLLRESFTFTFTYIILRVNPKRSEILLLASSVNATFLETAHLVITHLVPPEGNCPHGIN